jgi:hypothetical protein
VASCYFVLLLRLFFVSFGLNIVFSDKRFEYSSVPYLKMRIARLSAITPQAETIASPINASLILTVPKILRIIRVTGAVSGKNDRNSTIGDEFVLINNWKK